MSPTHPAAGPGAHSQEYLAPGPLLPAVPTPDMLSTTTTMPRASSSVSSGPTSHAAPQAPSGHVTTSSSNSAPTVSTQPAVAPTIAAASTLPSVPALVPCTRLQPGVRKPKTYSDGTIRYGNLTICKEPTNVSSLLANPCWKEAMDLEFSALIQNKT
jgi:hypothetical protein